MLPGVHRVQRKLKSGLAYEYWYAWRGGPQILKVGPLTPGKLAKAVAGAAIEAGVRYKEHTSAPADKATLCGLIARYLAPSAEEPDLAPSHIRNMAPRTLRDRRGHLDKIRESRLGEMELLALGAAKARTVLLDWRKTLSATPKTADERLYALSCVLKWAKDNGEISSNPIEKFDRIYSVDRSEIVWTAENLATLYRYASKEFADFVQVSVMTGIRLADLRKLPRSAIGPDAIVFQSGKSNKKRTVVVPLFDELKAVIEAIPAKASTTLLNSSRGRPWSEAGIESAIQRARADAKAEAIERGGPNAMSGIEGLRIHDLRGTAATNFIRWGMDDRDIATILGWKAERVSEIRRRYVSGQEIGLAMVRRIRENKARARL